MSDGPPLGPVVVPVRVSALCVNSHGPAHLLGPRHDFTFFPVYQDDTWQGEPYLSSSVKELLELTSPPGVHVHWLLPSALRRATYDRHTPSTSFPRVPDRWLVTRLSGDGSAPLAQRSWVVESNQRVDGDADQGSASFPLHDKDGDTDQFFQFQGRFHPYESWTDSNADEPLTAVGYGELSFATYYPSCRNVFGFFDSLDSDLATSPLDLTQVQQLTYRVVGWYADPAADPLALDPSSLGPADLGWDFDGAPTSTLCSGSVSGITWDPGSVPPASTTAAPAVSIGNSAAEALSALVATNPALPAEVDAEYLLNAVQAGLLGKLADDPERSAKMAFALHQQSFGHSPGGWVWALREPAPASGSKAPPPPPPQVPDDVADALAALNDAQQKYDEQVRALPDAARQLFLDWYRQMVLADIEAHPDDPPPPSTQFAQGLSADDVSSLVEDERERLVQARADAGHLTYLRQDGSDTLEPVSQPVGGATVAAASVWSAYLALLAVPGVAAMGLHRLPADRYWTPNDPVLVLHGDGVSRSPYLAADAGQSLACRMASELNDTLGYQSGPTLTAAQLAPTEDYGRLPAQVASAARSLLVETMIADPAAAATLGAAVVSAYPDQQLARVLDDLAELRKALGSGDTATPRLSTSGRVADEIGLATWAPDSWEPIYLRWHLEVAPVIGDQTHPASWRYATAAVTDNHVVRQGHVDLEIDPKVAAPAFSQLPYTGVVPLASNIGAGLASAVATALKVRSDDNLQQVQSHLPTGTLLAQELAGLHRMLLGLDPRTQVDVFSPDDPDTSAMVKAQVGSTNDAAPDGTAIFSPFRSAFVRLGVSHWSTCSGGGDTSSPRRWPGQSSCRPTKPCLGWSCPLGWRSRPGCASHGATRPRVTRSSAPPPRVHRCAVGSFPTWWAAVSCCSQPTVTPSVPCGRSATRPRCAGCPPPSPGRRSPQATRTTTRRRSTTPSATRRCGPSRTRSRQEVVATCRTSSTPPTGHPRASCRPRPRSLPGSTSCWVDRWPWPGPPSVSRSGVRSRRTPPGKR